VLLFAESYLSFCFLFFVFFFCFLFFGMALIFIFISQYFLACPYKRRKKIRTNDLFFIRHGLSQLKYLFISHYNTSLNKKNKLSFKIP
jgi:hypothetical protein